MIGDNGIKNKELSNCWEWLHNMEETVRDTPFSLDASVIDVIRKHLQQADIQVDDDSIPIKIVITGRMKAGKSMMADVLFFGGKGILNSDVTPATANITYIRCIDEQHGKEGAKVSFLKKADVEEMENYVSKQGEDGKSDDPNAFADNVRYRASIERLKKINADPSKRDQLLDKDRWIDLENLRQYSDTDGEYSNFVDQIEVYINDPRLKHLEIVDTPGLGDPVVSRGQKARDESRTAEVVFFLSRADEFMRMEDSDEFVRLKKAGCRNMVLIMSQFDEIYEPEGEELIDLKETQIYESIVDDGKERMQKAMRQSGIADDEPVNIIPICALGAKLSCYTLEKDDAIYRNKIRDLFPDLSNTDAVYQLSGMSRLQEEVKKAEDEREKIRKASNARIIQECRMEVDHLYQSQKEQIQNEIDMKKTILQKPDSTGRAKDALDKWENLLSDRVENTLYSILSEMIDKECEKIKLEIHEHVNSTKNAMDKAESPDSINGAYEYTFKNAVYDMFVIGIEGRMRFDNVHETYGEMFDRFNSNIRETFVPEEITGIKGLSDNLYSQLWDTFRSRIYKDYKGVLNTAMPSDNILEVLQDKYKEIREWSPDFKYKLNPRKSRAEKNANAIWHCKEAVHEAEAQIIEMLNYLSNTKMRDFFKDIQETLKSKLEAYIIDMKTKLDENKKEIINDEIKTYEDLLANLVDMETAEQES